MVDREFERARNRTVGFTTAGPLRGTSVTLTGRTSAFLRHGLLARAGDIAACLDALPDGLPQVLVVFEDVVDDVSSKRLIEVLLVQLNKLVGESTGDKVVDGHCQSLFGIERSLAPWLRH